MKTWNKPIIEELDICKTAHGSSDFPIPDWIFKDQDGNILRSSSGTGLDTDERKDVVDPINP